MLVYFAFPLPSVISVMFLFGSNTNERILGLKHGYVETTKEINHEEYSENPLPIAVTMIFFFLLLGGYMEVNHWLLLLVKREYSWACHVGGCLNAVFKRSVLWLMQLLNYFQDKLPSVSLYSYRSCEKKRKTFWVLTEGHAITFEGC